MDVTSADLSAAAQGEPMRIFASTRQDLLDLGLPPGDLWQLPSSGRRFADGGQFRLEAPTVNTVDAVRALLEEAGRLGVQINRVTETLGMFRHTRAEVAEFVAVCADHGAQLIMSPGPRATYDTGASVQSVDGRRIGYRLRGQEQLVRAIEDVRRGVDLGVRGFVVYDEGLLWALAQLRTRGALPPDLCLKVSAHCGHGNPAAAKVLEALGADSINPVRDLQFPMLAALRAAVTVPIDVHTDNPPSSGGFIRYYEAPEFVRMLAPVYLKTGNSVVGEHGSLTTVEQARRMARQAKIVLEMVGEYLPEACQSPGGGTAYPDARQSPVRPVLEHARDVLAAEVAEPVGAARAAGHV